jgi:putative tricarboxylic transport membrane protein
MADPSPIHESTPVSAADAREMTFWERWGELIVALAVVVLGLVILRETQDIKTRPGVTVSPRIIPNVIGGALVLIGLWYAADVVRVPRAPGAGEDSEDVDPNATTNWSAILIMSFALLCYLVLIDTAGFIIASAVMYVVSTVSMGSRRYLLNIAIGIVLATVIFYVFDGWLGVRLPAGWIEDWT